MSQESAEVVREMYEAFHAGDAEKALGRFAADVLVDPTNARPDLGVGKGREFVQATVASWMGTFEEWREEIEEIRELGSRVLVLSVQRGRGKGSGVEVEAHYALLYEVHGGEITGMRMYRNVADALEAVGVES